MTPRQRAQRRRNWLKRQRVRDWQPKSARCAALRREVPIWDRRNVTLKRSHFTMPELVERLRGEGWGRDALPYARNCKREWMSGYWC